MKSLILLTGYLFLSSFFIFKRNEEKNKNDLIREKLKGHVKSYTQYFYDVRNKNSSTTILFFKTKNDYNKEGKRTANYMYDSHHADNIKYYVKYDYDKQGRIITTTSKSGWRSKYNYTHNSKNNLVETQTSSSHTSMHIVYNKTGGRDTTLIYNVAGKLNSKYINHYNRKNDNTEQDWFAPDGTLSYKKLFKYDKNHNLIDELRLKADGTRESHETFKYDDKGNELMQIDSNKMHIGGLFLKKEKNKIYSRTFRYDKFDKAGNWVQQSYLIGNHFVPYAKREIEYY